MKDARIFPAQERPSCTLCETWCVIGLLCGFLVLNLLTSSRYPFVAGDEVTYSDPAINLYLEKGFTSTAWFAQTASEFWAGNVPLHPILLYF